MMDVPFNRAVDLPASRQKVMEALASGKLSGDGAFTRQCQARLDTMLGTRALLTTSATHALEMMALLLDIKPGDQVIVPSFTFVSTAAAFVLRGATVLFADNDTQGNLLPGEVERLVTPRTRAVVTVHYAGSSADMDALAQVCRHHGVALLEDAAQALGATYKGRPLGTLGSLACLSFHDTKNVTSGEGGALLVGDAALLERAEVLREKGTNRAAFLRGFVDKYTWVAAGSSYLPSEINAALLLPQLEQLDAINRIRGEAVAVYDRELSAVWEAAGVRRLAVPAYNAPNHHMYAVVFLDAQRRQSFMDFMRAHGVACPFHYVPLHTSPMGRQVGAHPPEPLPGCTALADGLCRLPLFYNMTQQQQAYVVEQVRAWARA